MDLSLTNYIASSTCTTASTTDCIYYIPSQLIGDIVFPLSVLVFLTALTACGLLFGTFLSRRR